MLSITNAVMTSTMYYVIALLLTIFKTVDAKECHFIYENGDIKYFHCNIYEYCCGSFCCRSPAITFYQMWYFWLMVFFTLIFCSGGGWWYRLRNRGPEMPSSLMSYASTRPIDPTYARTQMYPAVPIIHSAPAQVVTQNIPPPPYYGPPPSYDMAVNQSRQS